MIKLIIEIKEEDTIETNIHINEIGKKPTEHELKVSDILKNRLKVEEKVQFESTSSKDKLREELENLLKRL